MLVSVAVFRQFSAYFGACRAARRWLPAGLLVLALGACGDTQREEPTFSTDKNARSHNEYQDGDRETLFGPGGFFGGSSEAKDGGGGGGIGINSFLWRASLDTLAFMPLTSADPFGGVIITDWHSPQETPGERFKLNVYILDRRLRADGIKVALFRQVRGGGEWRDAKVEDETAIQLENAILRRARELRLATLAE
jgi:hypothetical protein